MTWATPTPLILVLARARPVGTCLVWPHGDSVERVRRFAYWLLRGPMPAGRELRSTCGTPWCVSPFHCEEHRIGIRNGGVTHCTHGHAYVEGSYFLQRNKRGGFDRVCRQCFIVRRRAYRQRLRAERVERVAA